ncbi:MAG: ABC transporter permease, partial [Longimicrobiales bacterium]
LAAVLTLAVGVGANATMFSLVDNLIIRPLEYERPDELLLIWNTLPSSAHVPVAAPDVAVLRERAQQFEALAFVQRVSDGGIESRDGTGAEHIRLARVTPDFFDVLGVEAAVGRTLQPYDAQGDGRESPETSPTPVVVMNHDLWSGSFGSDPAVVGSEILLNGRPAHVVGVMPRGFRLSLPPDAGMTSDVDIWTPVPGPLERVRRLDGRLMDQDTDNTGAVVGRLAAGASLEAARSEIRRLGLALQAEVPEYAAAGLGLQAVPLHEDSVAHARDIINALMAGVGIILLVACLNVSTLIIARGAARGPELMVRQALGADVGRLIRQLFAESLVLVTVSTILALLLAQAGMGALGSWLPPSLAPTASLELDGRVLLFTAGVAAVAVLLFGLIPAVQVASRERHGVMGQAITRAHGTVGVRSRVRSSLIVGEVALTVVLVLGAGLLIRTVGELDQVRPGFDARGALSFSLSLGPPDRYRYPGPAERARLMKEIEIAVGDLPQVEAVGLVGVLPLAGGRWSQPYGLPGQAESEWAENRADFRVISSGYFEAMGTRLVAGRTFTTQEDLSEAGGRVVIIDDKLAARIAGFDAPRGALVGAALGATIGVPLDGGAIRAEVVGIVEHVRHERLDLDGREAIYVPYRQEASRDVSFVVRVAGDPSTVVPALRATIREIDPQVPLYAVRSMVDYVGDAMAPSRFALALLGGFAVLGLVSVAVGLYGVVAFEVGRRTREIGLRMAIGATGEEVVRTVLGGGLRLAALGMGAGALLAVAFSRLLNALLFGVAFVDPLTWVGMLALVGVTTWAACWLPARRASRLDPCAALRSH